MNKLGISDVHEHLPTTIKQNNQRSVAHYIMDEIAKIEGLRFWYKSTSTLHMKPCNFPSNFAYTTILTFICSQWKGRKHKPQDRPFEESRNASSMALFECHGSINILFLANYFGAENNPHDVFYVGDKDCQIAVEYTHTMHLGREVIGVPVVVHEWIKNNPRPTAQRQWDDLFAAMDRGEIEIHSECSFLTTAHIHYWWRKMQVQVEQISQDPWINLEHTLKQDPKVVYP